jgi:hypothetical protein
MMLPAAVGKDPGVVDFMGVFPQRLPSAARTHPPFDIDITPKVMPRVYDIVSPLAAGKRKCSLCLPLEQLILNQLRNALVSA